MRSKNSKPLTPRERAHLQRVKEQCCSLCSADPPSDAHHIKQGLHFCTVALCRTCHDSWHGTKTFWSIYKMTELDALNVTLGRMHEH